MRSIQIFVVALAGAAVSGVSAPVGPGSSPSDVRIKLADGRYQLIVNGNPLYIKGAGIEWGSPEKLRAHGGNSFRTWSADEGPHSGKAILDRAWTNGLYVAVGLDVDHERRGFNYEDTNAVARQIARLTAEVAKLKDHPALLLWIVGNEMNLDKTPKVWDTVNELSRRIHQLDPHHPTTTALAGFKKETVELVRSRAPDLDFVSFQMYSDIVNLPRYLAESHWDKPYIVTEWGATGHWECKQTGWGAPIENDSTTKANFYRSRFEKAIGSDAKLCLGSYVFLWGQKQERTPTWYGMFLRSGEETAAVDAMQYLWTGTWPRNRSPELHGVWLDGKRAEQSIHLKEGQSYCARVDASDPENDALRYHWEIMQESNARSIGGDREATPKRLPELIKDSEKKEISLRAPDKPGAYRLFSYVHDGKGHAAHANIPFYVDAAAPSERASVSEVSERP